MSSSSSFEFEFRVNRSSYFFWSAVMQSKRAFVCNPRWRKCEGCSKRLFKPGDLCISVKGKYTPHHKDKNGNCFDIDGVFRCCVKFHCVTKCPPRSNLTTPPKEIILPADLNVTPGELNGMHSR